MWYNVRMEIMIVVDGVVYKIPAEAQAEIAAMFQLVDEATIDANLRALGCVEVAVH